MTTRKKSKYTEHYSEQTRKSKPLLERAHWQIQQLMRMTPDRQPDAEKQTPETEWRRQKDIASAMGLMRDVLVDVIRDLEDFGMYEQDIEKLIQSEEETENSPCQDPRNFVEWLMCWRRWWIYVRECCEENRGYWRKFFYTFHWMGQRHDDLMVDLTEKFRIIQDFMDNYDPPVDPPAEYPPPPDFASVRVFYTHEMPPPIREGDVWIQAK